MSSVNWASRNLGYIEKAEEVAPLRWHADFFSISAKAR